MLAVQSAKSEMGTLLTYGNNSGEEKPACVNCQRQGELCDYSVRLNWGGRAKRPSADSPSSQSSGYAGTVISFADPPPKRAATSIPQAPSMMAADGFVNTHAGEMASPSAISPSTPAHLSVFDSPKPPTGSNEINSPAPIDSNFATSWSDHSPLTPPVASSSLTHYPFGPNFHSAFSAAADQGVGLRSLSAFAFPSNSVSQPVSFLRHSLDASNVSEENGHSSAEQVPDDHRSEYSIHNMLPHENGSSDLSRAGGIAALMLGAQESMQGDHHFSLSHPKELASVNNADARCLDVNEKEEHAVKDSLLAQSKWQAYLTSVTDNYGLDGGRPDRDLALNNDHAAIDINSALETPQSTSPSTQHAASSALKPGSHGYYESPVPVNIPRYLSPLPSTLLENPINLMYFHHFLNHTSRMLVPHDCDKNPFISVLPAMAIGDPNLLNLMLAYSASHRARYLGHAEPANRIAHWVRDVFPTLRVALESSHEEITDSHLATAILLLSLKIVSPGTFEVPITWQTHLKLARDLFLARSERISRFGNRIGAFFARWLGYIDTVGALSCRQAGHPLMIYRSVLAACIGSDNYNEFSRFDELGNLRRDWHPSADIILEAQSILGDLEGLRERAHVDPEHHVGVEGEDMLATEEAFRCAGLLHLHRRVLGSSSDSYPVKEALKQLANALGRMTLSASLCCLLPLFTLAVEASPDQRPVLLDRFSELEKCGMKQIQDARQLVQRCWDGEVSWVSFATGEFFG
ncbi:hypothetical protein N7470_003658 [Penicillium chermesinum]|nr:hypothetical protein N7470_003658 [Penicillium chermesinum]